LLSHNGVLFLDELLSSAQVLEVMRQPLEDGNVTIAAGVDVADLSGTIHAGCGDEPVPVRLSRIGTEECPCSPTMIQRYVSKISGPLMDRIDIHIDVPAVNYKELRGSDSKPKLGADSRTRGAARDVQLNRLPPPGERNYSTADEFTPDSRLLRPGQ